MLRQEGQTVADYYARLKGLWDELDDYYGGPACSCVIAIATYAKEKKT